MSIATEISAPCECPLAAGVCNRHGGLFKPDAWKKLCATDAKYRAAWDAGTGPGQPGSRSAGLGDVIAKGIKAATFGLLPPCGGCEKRKDKLNQLFPAPHMRKRHPFHYDGSIPEFVTTAQLMDDVKRLVAKLPSNTSRILGTARSGLCVATMVAMLMHRPLSVVREQQKDVVDAGHGWRLTGSTTDTGPVVVVDDTTMTGGSFKRIMPIVRAAYPEAITAVVYLNPNANLYTPDLFGRHLRWPHLLEWNLFNSIVTPNMAVDFDGILCADCPPGNDDDGERYAAFLELATPLYYIRKHPIPLIVTARLEKYRPQTLAWLARHGMSAKELIMWPGTDHRERNRSDIGTWKAGHFKTFASKRRQIQPALFVESNAGQAKRIAEVSGGLVVCPSAGKVFSGSKP